jgi:hypothetical protein
MGIPYVTELKLLGVIYQVRITNSTKETWANITKTVKILAQEDYLRELYLTQRVKFVYSYLLSSLRHCSQVLPIASDTIRQIDATIN